MRTRSGPKAASVKLRNTKNTPKVTPRKLPPRSKLKKSTKHLSKQQTNASGRAKRGTKLPQDSVSDETLSHLKSALRSSTSKTTAQREARSAASKERKTKKPAVVLKSLRKMPTSPNDESPPAKRVLRQKKEQLPAKATENCPSTSRRRERSGNLSVNSGHPTPAAEAKTHTTIENTEGVPGTSQRPVEHTKEADPYELTEDENCPPTTTVAPKPRPTHKFFSKGRADRLKQSTYSAFNFFRGKIRMQARKPLRNLPATTTLKLREEHKRIAATTIWLPVPDNARPNTSVGNVRGGVLYSTPVSGALAAGGPFATLSSRPLVAMRGTDVNVASFLASPILPSKPSLPGSVVAVSTVDVNYNTWSQLEEAPPPPAPPLPSPLPSPALPPCSGNTVVPASTPSAAPLKHSTEQSVSAKSRSQQSSLRSLTPRHTSSRGHSTHEEDVSNYKEWLDDFNAQLEPYEDFNLTVD